jgi:hypothetical protein
MKVSVNLGGYNSNFLGFRERVLWLQEVLSRNITEEYDASEYFDMSSDFDPTFV